MAGEREKVQGMAGERENVQGNGNRRGCEPTGVAAFGTGTGWKYQPVPKGAATLRQRVSLFGTGWSFQPVPMEA